MFLPDGHDRTFGEMTSEEKHGLPPRGRGLSHRARAFSSSRRRLPCGPIVTILRCRSERCVVHASGL